MIAFVSTDAFSIAVACVKQWKDHGFVLTVNISQGSQTIVVLIPQPGQG